LLAVRGAAAAAGADGERPPVDVGAKPYIPPRGAAAAGSGTASARVSASAVPQTFTAPAVAVRGTTTASTVVSSLGGAASVSPAPSLVNPTLTPIDPTARADTLMNSAASSAPPPGAGGRAAAQQGASWLGLAAADLPAAGAPYAVEPPDQGLCVGNGYVIETVNIIMSVYSANGGGRLALTSLDAFLGPLPAGFSLQAGKTSTGVTDPSCAFDRATRRWYHLVFLSSTAPAVSPLSGEL
jgi:hypothetical protein